MIRLAVFMLILAGGLFLGPFVADHQGYVLIAFGHYQVELSAISAFLLLMASYFLFWLVEIGVSTVFSLNQRAWHWLKMRRCTKSQQAYQSGMLALMSGHFRVAQRQLEQSAAHSAMPVLHYLGAAQAAHALGHVVQRDDDIKKALNEDASGFEAVTIQRVQWLLEAEQYASARNIVQKALLEKPDSIQLNRLLFQSLMALEEYQIALEHLASLKDHRHSDATLSNTEIQLQQAYLTQLAQQNKHSELNQHWQELPKFLRKQWPLRETFYTLIAPTSQVGEYLQEIRQLLNKQAAPNLLRALAQVPKQEASVVIESLQSVLHKASHNVPLVHGLLGQLLLEEGLLKQAQTHLETAIEIQPCAADYYALGQVMEMMQLSEKAQTCYRSGLELCLEKPPAQSESAQAQDAA